MLNISRNGSLIRLPTAPQTEPSLYTKSLLDSIEPVLPTVSTTPFFADFSSTYYHPRSLIPITPPFPTRSSPSQSEFTSFAASGSTQISAFEAGADLFAARDADIDIFDTDLRLWLEECDGMQAVQIFTSFDDSWAGFATRYVEHIRDELGKGCIWVWGIDGSVSADGSGHQKQTRSQRLESLSTKALTIYSLAEQASMFVPLKLPDLLPPNFAINQKSLWHTSALLEAAVESSTLATRLWDTTGGGQTLRDWQDLLSGGGRQTVAQLTLDTNFDYQEVTIDPRVNPLGSSEANMDSISFEQQINLTPLTDTIQGSRKRTRPSKTFSKIESFRGPGKIPERALLKYKESSRGDRSEVYSAPVAFIWLPTYPRIFLDSAGAPFQSTRIHTSLETSTDVARWIQSLQTILRFSSTSSIDGEEREAAYDYLGGFAEKYVEDWESDDESDDD